MTPRILLLTVAALSTAGFLSACGGSSGGLSGDNPSVNDPPSGRADSYSLTTDGTDLLTVSAPGVLANDGDVDSSELSVRLLDDVASGELTLNADGSFTYEPDNTGFGTSASSYTDTFTYVVSDGESESAETSVSLNVQAASCAIPLQNQFVYSTMQDIYLWYEQIPDLNPSGFESPEALLEEIRFLPLDRFSYLDLAADDEAFLQAGEFVGLGFRSRTEVAEVVILDVFEGSPADAGGLVRGSRILQVDGVPIDEVLAAGSFSESLGPAEEGFEVSLTFENPDGGVVTSTLAKEVVAIPPVTATRIFDVGGAPTGYLVFRNFVDTGVPQLTEAFADFRAAGVRQVIVDLRYNTGGLVRVLEHFGDLLGGRIANNQVLLTYQFNDKNTNQNQSVFMQQRPESLDLDRVVFVTTPSSASASEMLINGLDPFVTDLVTVGDVTFGKPVGQLGYVYCDKILRPASFKTVNALGLGEFFDGIPVDCPAGDDPAFGFGATGEPSFDAAVYYLQNGVCPPVGAAPDGLRKPAAPRGQYELRDVL
ncbi:MAG: cadherin-like domain-containing protein [Gammaproteobacteria bacterium]